MNGWRAVVLAVVLSTVLAVAATLAVLYVTVGSGGCVLTLDGKDYPCDYQGTFPTPGLPDAATSTVRCADYWKHHPGAWNCP